MHLALVVLECFDFFSVGGLDESKYRSIFSIYVSPTLLVLVVLGWCIKVDDVGYCLELRLHGIAGLQDYHYVELSNVEKVDETLELILRQFRAQHEALQGKSIQEELYAICLDYVIGVYHCLAFQYSELQKSKEDNKLLEVRLALDIVVFESLNY